MYFVKTLFIGALAVLGASVVYFVPPFFASEWFVRHYVDIPTVQPDKINKTIEIPASTSTTISLDLVKPELIRQVKRQYDQLDRFGQFSKFGSNLARYDVRISHDLKVVYANSEEKLVIDPETEVVTASYIVSSPQTFSPCKNNLIFSHILLDSVSDVSGKLSDCLNQGASLYFANKQGIHQTTTGQVVGAVTLHLESDGLTHVISYLVSFSLWLALVEFFDKIFKKTVKCIFKKLE